MNTERALVSIGEPVADFTLPASGGQPITLSSLRGTPVVLYFYPRDSSPGCTTEANEFAALCPQLRKLDAVVLGISRDSVEKHDKFISKYNLPFQLLSDPDETIHRQFAVMKLRTLYGREVMAPERSTFIIDRKGVLVQSWRGIKVPNHAQTVLDYVRKMKA